jgi:hypothetical protein
MTAWWSQVGVPAVLSQATSASESNNAKTKTNITFFIFSPLVEIYPFDVMKKLYPTFTKE